MQEELTKASHAACLLLADLQAALQKASPIEALVLLPLISRAAEIESGLQALSSARQAA